MEEKKPEDGKKGEEEKKEEAKPAEKPTEEKKEEKKGEESKDEKESKEKSPAPPQEIILKVYMHCEGCARKVRRCLRGFEGYIYTKKTEPNFLILKCLGFFFHLI